jgi:hypothetical protein
MKLEVNKPMIANSRGSNRLAGAASLKNRMPAIVGTFRIHPDIAHWTEQQTHNLRVRFPLSTRCVNSLT